MRLKLSRSTMIGFERRLQCLRSWWQDCRQKGFFVSTPSKHRHEETQVVLETRQQILRPHALHLWHAARQRL